MIGRNRIEPFDAGRRILPVSGFSPQNNLVENSPPQFLGRLPPLLGVLDWRQRRDMCRRIPLDFGEVTVRFQNGRGEGSIQIWSGGKRESRSQKNPGQGEIRE